MSTLTIHRRHLAAEQPAARLQFLIDPEADVGLPPIHVSGPKSAVATFQFQSATGDLLAGVVRDWHWCWFYGTHTSTWSNNVAGDSFTGVEVRCPASTITGAAILDFDGPSVLPVSKGPNGDSISVPAFDSYRFVRVRGLSTH